MANKKRATDALLGQLHELVAKDLLKKVKSGEATAQELNAAIKFLKDNGIQGEVDNPDSALNELSKLRDILPSFEDETHD